MKRTLFLARFSIFCCGAVLVFAPNINAQQRRTARPHKTPKSASSVKTIAVQEIDVSGLKKLLARDQTSPQTAARPLLINFWATWCEPCREEFPDLVRINNYYKTRGLDFIIISLDDAEELNKGVPQFLREMRATMPAYLLNAPDGEAAMDAVDPQWSGALPATFLFSPRGQLIFSHTGRINPAELRQAIGFALKPENR